MKLVDRLTRARDRALERIRIWENPTAYNRATRRRAGIVRAKVSPFKAEASLFLPRYFRRHGMQGKFDLTTRRGRKRRARLLRIARHHGMLPA